MVMRLARGGMRHTRWTDSAGPVRGAHGLPGASPVQRAAEASGCRGRRRGYV